MQKYAILNKFFPDGINDNSKDKDIAEVIMDAIKFDSDVHWEEAAHYWYNKGEKDFGDYCNRMAEIILHRKWKQEDLNKTQG